MLRRLIASAALCATAAALTGPANALADGDPASDVLVYQPVFFPYAKAPSALERRLNGLVRSATSQGYRIRVAVIQSRRDLGSLPMLFMKPGVYARFLSAELSASWRDRVLVVMPDGYGLAQGARIVRRKGVNRIRVRARSAADDGVLARTVRPGGDTPADLVTAAARVVTALAARHDVALAAGGGMDTAAPSDGSSGPSRMLAAAVAAAVGLTAGLLWFLWRTRPRRG